MLTEALSGWRGDALAEFVYEDWAAAPVRRLEELRLVALEDRIEAQLLLGQGAELTGELEGLVGEYPLRERLRGQHMLALYRAGRQADALSAYQDARRALVDELGIDPSPGLVDLERQILQQDSVLMPSARSRPSAEGAVEDTEAGAAPSPPPARATESLPAAARPSLCAECGAAVVGGAKFCFECGTALTPEPPSVERQQRKLVTVLFCDMVGSTALAERLDAEVVRGVMNRFFDAASAVISRHGGSVEKFIGDAVVAMFGVPLTHEDDALRAVRAADEIHTAVTTLADDTEQRWGVRVETRIGVNTGEVVVGVGVAGSSMATGDTVNVAARLEQTAAAGEILLGDTTWQLVRDAVVAEARRPVRVRGKAEPIVAHRLERVLAGVAGHARRMDLPLVGRESELRLLRDSFERWSAERACGLVTVLGTAGVGKSRLVAEFIADLGDAARVVRGRCLSYGSGITYWPLAEAIRQLAGIEEEHTPDDVRERLAQMLGGTANTTAIVSGVSALMGVEGSDAGADESKWALRRAFEHIARDRPLVVVLDDLQWGETPFLDLVDHLADSLTDAPVLLLCMARPELLDVRPAWGGGKLNATTILLEPLDPAHSDELVTELLGGRTVPHELRIRVASAAAGNPLFAEELLAYLLEEGHITVTENTVTVGSNLDEVELPPTIRALIGARLDQLPAVERGVLERGAVEGQVFHAGSVSALSDGSSACTAELQRLVRKQVLKPDTPALPGEDAFRFRHLLIRDATYDGVPKQLRAQWHRQFAQWLEATVGQRVSEYEEILAYHYAAACRYLAELGDADAALVRDQATELLRRSANRALSQEDLENAALLLAQLVELLPLGHEERAFALADRALALEFTAGWQTASTAVQQAIDEASIGSRESQIYVKAVEVRLQMAKRSARFAALAEELTPLAEEASAAGWHRAAARAWVVLADAFTGGLHAETSRDAVARAREHAREGLRWLEPTIDFFEAAGTAFGSVPIQEAIVRCEEIFPPTATRPSVIAVRAVCLGWLAAMSGDLEAGMAYFDEAGAQDVVVVPLLPSRARGMAFAYLGLAEQALPYLIHATNVESDLGQEGRAAATGAAAARAFAQLGRVEEAVEQITRAEAMTPADDVETHVLLCGARSRLHVISGNHVEAYAEATREASLIEGTDFAEYSGVALIDLAWVSLKVGKPDEARSAARRAVDILNHRGAIPMRDLAQALLNEAEHPVMT